EPGGIFQISTATGDLRRVTTNPVGGYDFDPAVSPDGQSVAFARYENHEDIYVVRTSGGPVRQVTQDRHVIRGVAWADNREILFSSDRSGGIALWRIVADGHSEPHPVSAALGEAKYPAIARPAKAAARLAF